METSRIIDVSPQRAHDSDRDPLAPDRENPTAIPSSRSPPTIDILLVERCVFNFMSHCCFACKLLIQDRLHQRL